MIAWLAMAALAAAPGDDDWVAPSVSAETWTPSLDARAPHVVTDGRAWSGVRGRLDVGLAHRPLVWVGEDGSEVAVVRDAATAWAVVAAGYGPVVVGAAAPVVWFAASESDGPHGPLAGDPSLQLKVAPLDPDGAVSAALVAGITAPVGASARQLGAAGWGWELGVAADARIGPVDLLARLVTRGVPSVALGEVEVDDALGASGGAAWQATERVAVTGEVAARVQYTSLRTPGAHAAEAIAGLRAAVSERVGVRLAGGAPLTVGVGVPRWRAVLGIDLSLPAVSQSSD